ncbi:MAG: hypothetical protein AB7O68_16605 [Pirellulales bacterium]
MVEQPKRPRFQFCFSTWFLLVAILAACLFGALYLRGLLYYDSESFVGDGSLSDGGFWSYPRYRIEFPAISLSDSNVTQFCFSGPPTTRTTFKLAMTSAEGWTGWNFGEQLRSDVRLRGISVDVVLVDSQGRAIMQYGGPLQQWMLMQSDAEGAFWHVSGRNVPLNKREAYTLTVRTTASAGNTLQLTAKPLLYGGGNEGL